MSKTTNRNATFINNQKLIFDDGEEYNGDVDTTTMKPHGKGRITWKSGNSFTGCFKQGVLEGNGIYTVPNVCIYFGQFDQNKANGKGDLKWADGRHYNGTFKNNLFHGEGKFVQKNNLFHKGTWNSGKLDGPGI